LKALEVTVSLSQKSNQLPLCVTCGRSTCERNAFIATVMARYYYNPHPKKNIPSRNVFWRRV